ncbi:MAG TPA: hypothetical protein VK610_07655 [Rhodothermales bacterium]|nr:hypothetical protein [Rhodothermales bacterium]
MRVFLPLALAVLAACASPEPPGAVLVTPGTAAAPDTAWAPFDHPRPPFDARTWIADARALGADTTDAVETRCYGNCTADERARARRAHHLVNALDTKTGWRAVCGDEVSPDSVFAARGYFNLRDLGPDEHLITVWCTQSAYNNDQVVIHLEGDSTSYLENDRYALVVGATTNPVRYSSPGGDRLFGHVLDIDPATRTFTSRDHFTGTNGVWYRHRVGTGSTIETVEIRSNAWDLGGDVPEEWPLVPFQR